jgi:cell division septal protein FtsQ
LRPLLWLVGSAIATAMGYGVLKVGSDPRLALDGVSLTGARRTPLADITSAAAFPPRRNIWLLDTGSAVRRIESLPWIESARIDRAWPNRVSISVTERVPVARLAIPASRGAEEPDVQVALIDASLHVLASGSAEPSTAGLPLFRILPQPADVRAGVDESGTDVERVYDAMVQLRALGLRISELDLAPATGIRVRTAGGLHVILGSNEEFAKKVALYKAILPKIGQPENVVYVDLRSVRAPTVLYR